MMQVKGVAIFTISHFIKNKFGEEAFKKWVDSLSPEAKLVYAGNIQPGELYPLTPIFTEPIVKICEMFFNGDYTQAAELGRFSADYSLTGIYKFFIKLGSPGYVVGKASSILLNYYQPSSMLVIKNEKNLAILHVTDFTEMHKVIEYRIAGWMKRAIELTGMKNVNINVTKSLTRGDKYTEFIGSWEG